MQFDYKERMQKREQLINEQDKLLNQLTESIKQPFQQWYKEVDKSKVKWSISLFLIDCGYQVTKIEDFMCCFLIPTGVEDDGLNTVELFVKQYSVRFVIGEQIRELTLETLRGDTNEEYEN